MGAACKKDEIEIRNLYTLYLRVSKQKLPDKIAIELHSIHTRLIKDKIPKECQLIYNILLNNIQEESIQESQRIKFEQVQILDYSNIQNDKTQQLFFLSFRFLNFEELRKYINNDDYKTNSYNSKILNLFNATDIYCKKIRLFLSRLSPKYYMSFYSQLWKQFKQNVEILRNIFPLDYMNNDKFQKIPFNFTFQLFMYKIWGNNIQPHLNKIQIRELLHNKKNDELNQYFTDFIEISINEYQLKYSGNIGLTHSKGFKSFLNQLLELMNEEFDKGCNRNLEEVIKYVNNNSFLNQQLNEQVLIHYIYPSVFQYIETQLSMKLKGQFKVTKQYLKDQIIQDKVQNNTLSKLLLEEDDENYTKSNNIQSSQCKTNYTSSLKANYLSVQNQDETTFFNFENNKWEYFTNVQHSSYLNMVEESNKVDQAKQKIDERSNKLFKKFKLETLKQQDFVVQYINVMFDYTHINNKEETSELILQLNLLY